jgi:hypothetical protein
VPFVQKSLRYSFFYYSFEIQSTFKNKHMKKKRLIGILGVVVFLLLIPFTAMQFTDDVNWGAADFAMAGVLLFGTGTLCDLAIRKVNKVEYRIAICVATLIAFLLVWAELAVGIFGTPFAGT